MLRERGWQKKVFFYGKPYSDNMRNWLFNHIDFSTYPNYPGDDLGVFWSPHKTIFKIWAPSAKEVELRLYNEGTGGRPVRKINTELLADGVWAAELDGDLEGYFYSFKVNDGTWLHELPDIYARCVGVNGKRGMIFDPQKTIPPGWDTDKGPRPANITDAIIYETHIRDFSISESSGIKNKGKYAGFTETGTRSPEGMTTGLDHLTELGITHVHLLPFFDFYKVNEERPLEKYNWGYDPQNFNAPEGSYSLNPYDGRVRIRELKELIKALHSRGIGIIMDVVYNHTGLIRGSGFNQVVPGYFYRQKPDGTFANASGCGNEIATERTMVRKYIIDSLKYWATEYHIDGFRFDLMGVYDLETMQEIRKAMDNTVPGILLYGEGWAADLSPLPEEQRAVKRNIPKLPGIAAFNDDIRNALKGHWSNKYNKGFISGLTLHEEAVKFGIVAAVYHPRIVYDYIDTTHSAWADEPGQCINYVSCHDNYTLWDKLVLSNPDASDMELRQMVKLASAILLTSQGVPFLHSGVEFCRTKGGHENSYKSPDSVNQLDWGRKATYQDVFEYIRKLIHLRKNHPAFRMPKSDQIREYLKFCTDYEPGVVGYCIDGLKAGDTWQQILVIFNANKNRDTIKIPEGRFHLVARGSELNENGLNVISTGEVLLEPVSMTLLVKI